MRSILCWPRHGSIRQNVLQLADEPRTVALVNLPAAPVTVYRALDFLQENGLIHKIERLNAFVACTEQGERHNTSTRCSS